jgi:hypothetical protein
MKRLTEKKELAYPAPVKQYATRRKSAVHNSQRRTQVVTENNNKKRKPGSLFTKKQLRLRAAQRLARLIETDAPIELIDGELSLLNRLYGRERANVTTSSCQN